MISMQAEKIWYSHTTRTRSPSEAANGKPFATYWMHNAFLNIDNKKMSKSLGNFRTVREISGRYHLQVLRFFMLSAHYRSPLNFSAELMEASRNGLERILTGVERLNDLLSRAAEKNLSEEEKKNLETKAELVKKFEAAMDDDFNTADAISAVFELVKLSNSTISEESGKAYLSELKKEIETLCGVLGIITEKKKEALDSEIEAVRIEDQTAGQKV